MRIYDLCCDCKHFEHKCGEDTCYEYCHHPKSRTRDRFYSEEESITKCGDFKSDN